MGAARGMWDAAKHLRGYHGRFAGGVDVSETRNTGVRAAAAFQPPKSAASKRARLQRIRDAVSVFNRDPKTLTYKERGKVEWQSPTKIAEQLALTGDTRMPRREGMRREAGLTGGRTRGARSYIKGGNRTEIVRHPRTGKLMAKRGTREVVLASGRVRGAKRAHRAFDLPPKGKVAGH